MNWIDRTATRLSAAVGLAASVAYLAWRLGWSMRGVPMWLAVPALLAEVAGIAGSALLIWALTGSRSRRRTRHAGRPGEASLSVPVDVVVRVANQSPADLRATLLGARSMLDAGRIFVVDLSRRLDIAEVATELGAEYVECEQHDLNGLAMAMSVGTTDMLTLLDAGDVPSRDLVVALLPCLDASEVAVAQGMATTPAIDSPEHGANGVHELQFERTALNPALGRRGAAIWLGSGSLVRRSAFESVTIGHQHPLPTQWAVSAALLASGRSIDAPGGLPLISVQPAATTESVYEDRVRRARAARRLLVGRHGVFGVNALSLRQRASMLAWAVRPLSGLVRGVFIAVLIGSMLSGKLPLALAPAAWLWAPASIGSTMAVVLLSRGTLRLGDRTRWSLITLGAAFRGLSSPPVLPSGLPPLVSFRTIRHGAALVGAVIAISTVMALRGVSDRLTHTLLPVSQTRLVGLMLVGLWLLGMSLDAMRLLARRGRMRRAFRVVASLPAQFGECPVFAVDLTPMGAGLVSEHLLRIGESASFEMVLPTASGCTTATVAATVRNVHERPFGGWRIGVEFLAPSGATADALAEHCVIEPARRAMGELGAVVDVIGRELVDEVQSSAAEDGRRSLLRVAAAVAIVGATASVAPQPAGAAGPARHRIDGVVIVAGDGTDAGGAEGLGGVVVVAVCSLDPGVDGTFGTDDDAYGPISTTTTAVDGTYELALEGDACWASIPPPDGYDIAASTDVESESVFASSTVQPIDLGNSDVSQQVLMVATSTAAQPSGTDDVVWSDLDADGVKDVDEPGLAGVVVTMYDASGEPAASSRTDGAGHFEFMAVPLGLYSLGVSSLPDGSAAAADARTGRSALLPVVRRDGAIGVGVGVAPASAETAMVAQPSARPLLPVPSSAMVSPPAPATSATLALLVALLAFGLAGSLVLSFAAGRQRLSGQSMSSNESDGEGGSSSELPDLAMR